MRNREFRHLPRVHDSLGRANLVRAARVHLRNAYACSRAHSNLAQWAEAKFGDHGALISGVVRDHFPPQVKAALRALAHRVGTELDDSRNAWWSACRRHSTWMREKELTIARDGRGFYG